MINIRHLYRRIFPGRPTDKKQAYSKFIMLMAIGDEFIGMEELRRAYEAGVVAMHRGPGIREMFETMDAFDTSLAGLVAEGYAEEESGRFRLTKKGADISSSARGKITSGIESMSNGLHATAMSIVVNIVVAVVSLAAGIISNSMGLISSGVDNSTSIATSAAAYVGIRYKKETIANIVIVVVILALSLVLGYESVIRLLHPEPVDSGLMPIVVAIFTGIACYLLSLYQRYHGCHSGKFSLIILAVDNINSVLISVAVLVGVIFARFGFPFVDSLVSLGIAIVMLKSAIDLGRETLSIAEGKEPDLSQYDLGIDKRIVEARKYRTKFWILYLLRESRTAGELDETFSGKYAEGIRVIAEQLWIGPSIAQYYAECLRELIEKGLAACNVGRYSLTPEGVRKLSEAMAVKRNAHPDVF